MKRIAWALLMCFSISAGHQDSERESPRGLKTGSIYKPSNQHTPSKPNSSKEKRRRKKRRNRRRQAHQKSNNRRLKTIQRYNQSEQLKTSEPVVSPPIPQKENGCSDFWEDAEKKQCCFWITACLCFYGMIGGMIGSAYYQLEMLET